MNGAAPGGGESGLWRLIPGYDWSRRERLTVALLSSWFFLTIATLWLLKPVRTASLLAHLGAAELPYLRFGSVAAMGLLVLGYSRIVGRATRLGIARGASLCFAAVLVVFWLALYLGGPALGAQRWFVWAVFILVEVYSTVMVQIFWTYADDVVSRTEADKLYGPIGVGGILGGVAGGAFVDTMVKAAGSLNLLLVCVGVVLLTGGLAWVTEIVLKPKPRVVVHRAKTGLADALEGAREVVHQRYLLWIVGIVVFYEFASALTDFVINVVFERSFATEAEIAQMYGRLGWIVSATALVAQLVIVPLLLPWKRVALLVPPVTMAVASAALWLVPGVTLCFVLAASDRGLNYSLQQVTKETLYVPLTDTQRYKAKAFIDMFVDRGAKALSSVALLTAIARMGVSIPVALGMAIGALVLWGLCSQSLGRAYSEHVRKTDAGKAS